MDYYSKQDEAVTNQPSLVQKMVEYNNVFIVTLFQQRDVLRYLQQVYELFEKQKLICYLNNACRHTYEWIDVGFVILITGAYLASIMSIIKVKKSSFVSFYIT